MVALAPASASTTALEFEIGDERWHAMRKRALGDLYFLASVVLGYGDVIPMRESAHKIFCRFLERKTGVPALDNKWVRKIEMPRGTGKTTLDQAYIILRLCQEPNLSILLCNEKEGNAKAILGAIKSQFENNELFRRLFPEVIPDNFRDDTWSATAINVKRITTRKEPSVFVIGEGGTVTGMHPDEIVADDIVSREMMESLRGGSLADLIGQVNRWIHQLVPLLSGHPRACITFIGTRWWYNDPYEHIEESFGYGQEPEHFLLKITLSDGSVQRLPAYSVGDVAVFRRAAIEDGKPAFEELGKKYTLESLAKFRLQDPELFGANMMNNPVDSVTATFKDTWLRYYDWLSDDQIRFINPDGKTRVISLEQLDVVLLVDPGGFRGAKGRDRARPAFCVVGSLRADGLHFLLRAWGEKATYVVCQQEVVQHCRRYKARKAFVERNAQQIAFIDGLRAMLQTGNVGTIVEEIGVGASKAKDDRILGLEEYFQRSQIYVGRGADFHEFRTQYDQFPKSARNDILDALAWGPVVWPKMSGRQSPHAQRQRQEVAQYLQRRGVA